jgi:hypothetical protein
MNDDSYVDINDFFRSIQVNNDGTMSTDALLEYAKSEFDKGDVDNAENILTALQLAAVNTESTEERDRLENMAADFKNKISHLNYSNNETTNTLKIINSAKATYKRRGFINICLYVFILYDINRLKNSVYAAFCALFSGIQDQLKFEYEDSARKVLGLVTSDLLETTACVANVARVTVEDGVNIQDTLKDLTGGFIGKSLSIPSEWDIARDIISDYASGTAARLGISNYIAYELTSSSTFKSILRKLPDRDGKSDDELFQDIQGFMIDGPLEGPAITSTLISDFEKTGFEGGLVTLGVPGTIDIRDEIIDIDIIIPGDFDDILLNAYRDLDSLGGILSEATNWSDNIISTNVKGEAGQVTETLKGTVMSISKSGACGILSKVNFLPVGSAYNVFSMSERALSCGISQKQNFGQVCPVLNRDIKLSMANSLKNVIDIIPVRIAQNQREFFQKMEIIQKDSHMLVFIVMFIVMKWLITVFITRYQKRRRPNRLQIER